MTLRELPGIELPTIQARRWHLEAKMKLISREELKEKLDNAEDIKLVFALSVSRYRVKHIPGSLHFDKLEEALQVLDKDDEIIVYCANPACPASITAYHFLIGHGYKNVRRYAGGLQEWEDAGYPLEGEGAIALTGG